MSFWPWLPKQEQAFSSNTSGTLAGRCERCNDYAMVVLGGRQWLCWNHYVEAMEPYRADRMNAQSNVTER